MQADHNDKAGMLMLSWYNVNNVHYLGSAVFYAVIPLLELNTMYSWVWSDVLFHTLLVINQRTGQI